MDPAEIRLKNFIGNDEFPFATATGLELRQRRLRGAAQEGARRRWTIPSCGGTAARRRAQEGKLIGIGISTYGEICAFGPSPATPAGGWESATVKIDPTGKVTVMTGISPHGQGEETTFAQIAADELGVDIDDVMVLHGDTSHRAVRHRHVRQPRHGGRRPGALLRASGSEDQDQEVRRDAARNPTTSLSPAALCVCNRALARSVSLAEIAAPPIARMKLPPNTEPGLVATHFWEPPNFTFPFGAHIVVTEVDRETGACRDPALRRGGRLRQHHQSAAGRRTGARRRRAGDRPGALRAGRLRRQRPADHRRAHGLRDSEGDP